MKINDKKFLISTEYSFTSGIGGMEASRYLNDYSIKIKAIPMHGDEEQLIGKGRIVLVLTGLAINHRYDPFEIFDWSHNLLHLGETIYDFESHDYKEELQQFYDYELLYDNIFFLERLELLPEYRGHGLGKKIVKEFIERFSGCCGLIALKAFPLQLEVNSDTENDWYKRMRINELVNDEEQAKYQLYAYYKSLGFDQPFNNEYFTMNPAWKNEALEAIELD